jgi:hypothetical protein
MACPDAKFVALQTAAAGVIFKLTGFGIKST